MGRLRKSINGRASPRNYGVSALRKPPSFRGRRPGLPVFADKRQVNVLKKGLDVLNNAGATDSGPGAPPSTEDVSSSKKIPMKVAVRVRPLSARESTVNAREIVTVSGPKMLVFDPERQKDDFYFKNQKVKDITAKKHKNISFAFDNVYERSSTNSEIYEDVMKPLMDSLLGGFNCSVFAYGATGSGKTYTMLGSPGNPGLTYLTISDLYQRLDAIREDYRVDIFVAYFEVYNEQIHDLLHHTGTPLQIMEKGGGKLEIKNLSEHQPQSVDQLFEMLSQGNQNRSQHPTDHNAESSRSHAILQVTIQMNEKHSSSQTSKKSAKLVMVDLAGSEKGSATGFSGQRFQEGSSINKSLLALGKVMETLATGKKAFTYRDSKLTRILKDSLGGNSRTVMIANVSPAEGLYDDTLNTLRYAQKAKKISCDASKNVITVRSCLTEYTRVVDEMTTKIQRLEQQVKEKDERLVEMGQLQTERDEVTLKLSGAIEQVMILQRQLAESEEKLRDAEVIQQKGSHKAFSIPLKRPLRKNEKVVIVKPSWQIRDASLAKYIEKYKDEDGTDDEEEYGLPIDQEYHTSESSTGEDHLQGFYFPSRKAFYQYKGTVLVMRANFFGQETHGERNTFYKPDASNFLQNLEPYLKWNETMNGDLRPKIEKLYLEFKMKLEHLRNLKRIFASTGDDRYEKAVKRACRKLSITIKELWSTYGKATSEGICPELPFEDETLEKVKNAYIISEKQLVKLFTEKTDLQSALGELKILHNQVSGMSREVIRKDTLLMEASGFANKMRNVLSHYNQLSPDLEKQYDKFVSSYCSPSLQFDESEKFKLNTLFSPESVGSISQCIGYANVSSGEITCYEDVQNYLKSCEERLNTISVLTADISELKESSIFPASSTSLQSLPVVSLQSEDDVDLENYDIMDELNSTYPPTDYFSLEDGTEVSPNVYVELGNLNKEAVINQSQLSAQEEIADRTFVFVENSELAAIATGSAPLASSINSTFTYGEQENDENLDPIFPNDNIFVTNSSGLMTVQESVAEFVNLENPTLPIANTSTSSSLELDVTTRSPSLLIPPRSFRTYTIQEPNTSVADVGLSQGMNTATFSGLKPVHITKAHVPFPAPVTATTARASSWATTYSKNDTGGQKRTGVVEPVPLYRSACAGTKAVSNYCFKAPTRTNSSPSKLVGNESSQAYKSAAFAETKSKASYGLKNTPRSASPSATKTYQIGIGANRIKTVSSSSVGKIPSAKRVPQERSPYAKSKVKLAMNTLRRTSSSTSSLHKRNASACPGLSTLLKTKLPHGPQQEKGKPQPTSNLK